MKKMNFKSIVQFLVLCIGGNLGLAVFVLRSSFYDSFLEAFQITNVQFGALVSAYSTMTVLTYFLGGILADKLSPRKMIAFSMVSTGLLTIYLGTFPAYNIALIVYGLMGVTSTLTFWAAMIKVTRQFGQNAGGEGKALGGLEGGRALSQMVIGTIAIYISTRIGGAVASLSINLYFCGTVLIVMGILAFLVFSDVKDNTATENPLKLIKKCMKDPSVWVIAFMVMGCYALTTTLNGYASKIATIGFGTSATMAAVIGMFNQYFKPFGAIGGGFLSDRVGASKTLFIAIGALIVGTVTIAFMPKSSATLVLFLVIFAITIVFVGIARGQFYAPMQEAKIPLNLTGTATGLIATIAYTPDIFLPPISGKILDTFEGAQALQYILLMLAAFGLFALIMCMIFIKLNKKNIAELQQAKKELRLEKKGERHESL